MSDEIENEEVAVEEEASVEAETKPETEIEEEPAEEEASVEAEAEEEPDVIEEEPKVEKDLEYVIYGVNTETRKIKVEFLNPYVTSSKKNLPEYASHVRNLDIPTRDDGGFDEEAFDLLIRDLCRGIKVKMTIAHDAYRDKRSNAKGVTQASELFGEVKQETTENDETISEES